MDTWRSGGDFESKLEICNFQSGRNVLGPVHWGCWAKKNLGKISVAGCPEKWKKKSKNQKFSKKIKVMKTTQSDEKSAKTSKKYEISHFFFF